MKSVNDYTYYVVVEPRYQGDFRPSVLDYGLTFEAATNVMRSYINERGLKFKENGKHYPCHIYIKRSVVDELPTGYRMLILKNLEIVKV